MNELANLTGADGGLRELALFAGAGGGILGGSLLGWRTVCAVEWEPYPASVLAARQNDGLLPAFPIWDDVRTFDGTPWRGIVDVVSGGFPCQDISLAGKGTGISGERSGMWTHMARIIGEVRPRFAFVENSPALLTRGLGVVLSDLAALGYDCKWTVLGAADVGAPHRRERFWLVAHATGEQHESQPHAQQRQAGAQLLADSDSKRTHGAGTCSAGRLEPTDGGGELAHAHGMRELQPQGCQCDQRGRSCDCGSEGCHADSEGLAQWQSQPGHARQELPPIERADWWQSEPDVGRKTNGMA